MSPRARTLARATLQAAAPVDWKDTLIRTLKTAIAAAAGALLMANLYDLAVWKAAAEAGVTTIATLLLNAVLSWANS